MSTTPMTATQWLTALEREGVDVIGYGSWMTHGRDSATGKPFGPVNGVVIHHTAGSDSMALCYNGTSSLPGPLCHTYLGKSGIAYQMSVHRANHAGTFAQNAHDAVLAEAPVHPYPDAAEPVDGNDKYYGIEIENLGNGSDPYPWAQYVTAVKWATAICRFHGWTHNSVIGHKEGTRRKIDPKGPVVQPGGNEETLTMNGFRADVRDALALPAGVWPNTQEEEVALTQAEIDALAVAVYDKLADNGGILNQSDLDRVWQNVIVPAVAPPNNNPDWTTGTTVWTARYAMSAAVQAAREAKAAIAEVKAKVDSLSTAGVDPDALAAKVADELQRRLQS